MVRSLLTISSLAVRNAVVDGRITDGVELPLELRRWIFEMFRMKYLLGNENVLQFLSRPGFFTGFASIEMHRKDGLELLPQFSWINVYDGKFPALLATIFVADRRLAENMTELSLYISHSSQCPCGETRWIPRVEDVQNVLGLCKSLKRLRLIGTRQYTDVCLPELHCSSEPVDVSLPALEHLSLVSFCTSWILNRFTGRIFESIQSLELIHIYFDEQLYSNVFERCRDTLVSLRIVDRNFVNDIFLLRIRFPTLSSLSLRLGRYLCVDLGDIVEHCPNLTTAKFEFKSRRYPESELAALAQLSNRLQLQISYIHERHFDTVQFATTFGENLVGLQLSCKPSTVEDCRQLLSHAPNLKSLEFDGCFECAEQLLSIVLTDKNRAAKLTELSLRCYFSPTILEALFSNCCNLQNITLWGDDEMTDISDYLQTWVRNGARPSWISIEGFRDIHPESVYALMRASGPRLKSIVLNVRKTDENVPAVCRSILSSHCPFVEACLLEVNQPQNVCEMLNQTGQFYFDVRVAY